MIDTAGLRKKSKVNDDIEFYSNVRTNKIIAECNIAVLMIDAEKVFDKQDKDIIRKIINI